MSKFLDCQDGAREPIEYTHFDCWVDEETGEELEDDSELELVASIIESWDKTLGTDLALSFQSVHGSTVAGVRWVAVEHSLSLAIMEALRVGYDVYWGDNFIEIYAGE